MDDKALGKDEQAKTVVVMQGDQTGQELLKEVDGQVIDANFKPKVVMAEAPHGTAPGLQGKNVANPLAMILAGGSLLEAMGTDAARAIHEAVMGV